jgi:hypothetical protein
MLGTAWLTLRHAQEALKNGRLEEAHRLLNQSGAQGHKRSWDLLQQIGRGYVERGQRHLRQNDPEAAWHDLLKAEQVGMNDGLAVELRQTLTRLALAEVRGKLEAGDPVRAGEAIALLRERFVRQPELQPLEDAARDWVQAQDRADKGEFPTASQAVERLRQMWPQVAALERFRHDLEQRREVFGAHLLRLHEAVAGGHWRDVIQLADQVLAAAPQNGEARKARVRAWQVIEPATVASNEHKGKAAASVVPVEAPPRFLLWIDGVGGYLVCLAPRVTIGQAVPESTVDVALFADVSRHHATLTRDAEGYLLEAVRPLQVNAQPVEKALLQPGDRVTLGGSCQMLFRQPVPVSATARLDLASGHRLAPAVEGVIMMADTLVLGPSSQAHVTMPDLRQPVVLFRQKAGLGIRFAGNFAVDGQRCSERGVLRPTSMVSGDDFTFAIEALGTGMGRA